MIYATTPSHVRCNKTLELSLEQYLNAELKDDETFILEAIKRYAKVFQYASPRLKDNDAVVLAAVSLDGKNLQWASARLQDDEAIVLAALNSSSHDESSVLQYASPRLKDLEAIVLAALHGPGRHMSNAQNVMCCASERLQNSEAFMVEAFKACGGW